MSALQIFFPLPCSSSSDLMGVSRKVEGFPRKKSVKKRGIHFFWVFPFFRPFYLGSRNREKGMNNFVQIPPPFHFFGRKEGGRRTKGRVEKGYFLSHLASHPTKKEGFKRKVKRAFLPPGELISAGKTRICRKFLQNGTNKVKKYLKVSNVEPSRMDKEKENGLQRRPLKV